MIDLDTLNRIIVGIDRRNFAKDKQDALEGFLLSDPVRALIETNFQLGTETGDMKAALFTVFHVAFDSGREYEKAMRPN